MDSAARSELGTHTSADTDTQPAAHPEAGPVNMPSDRDSTLRLYLSVIRRRWLVMLVALIVPIAIGVAVVLSTTKKYEGTAIVIINRQSLADEVTGTSDPSASSSDFLNIINTYAAAAHSVEVTTQVAKAVPAAHLNGDQLLSDSTVTARQDADVVQFAVTDPDPALALRLARVYAAAFVRYQQNLNVMAIDSALRQVDARLANARAAGDKALSASLRSRDSQLRTLKSLQTADNYVVHPTTSASQSSPRRALDIGLGVLAGIVLAVLIAATLESLWPPRPTPAATTAGESAGPDASSS